MSAAFRRRGCQVVLLTVALAVSNAGRVRAWIPEPESAWSMVAQSNSAASRTRALALDIALIGADGAVVATGTARVEPNGRARLAPRRRHRRDARAHADRLSVPERVSAAAWSTHRAAAGRYRAGRRSGPDDRRRPRSSIWASRRTIAGSRGP
jgi:hypothetical protein